MSIQNSSTLEKQVGSFARLCSRYFFEMNWSEDRKEERLIARHPSWLTACLILLLTVLVLVLGLYHLVPRDLKGVLPIDGGSAVPLVALRAALPATGPLRVDPANSRYFTDGNGKAIFLTGSHTWDNFQDMGSVVFDYPGYLSKLQMYNHNFMRLWVWEQPKGITTGSEPAQPNATLRPEIFKRTGPGTAADGGLKFDVTQYNQVFFDRLRQRVIDAGNKGIYVSIMLFDGWSVEKKAAGTNPWIYHPLNANNNVNGLNGDPNHDQSGAETHTLQIPAITAMQEAYVRKVIDTVDDLDNVLYEISNESDTPSTAWEYHMIDYIHNYEAGKAKQHPVGMTAEYPGGNNSDLFASPADWISPNGDGGYADNPPAATGNKVVILDTDHIWGLGGDRVWAWKSFTRGYSVIYMDPWNGTFIPASANEDLRVNMGYILSYAERMNLETMTPRTSTSACSTQYCLVKDGMEYLVYRPSSSGSVTVNLTAVSGQLSYEWFNPATGSVAWTGTTTGGASRTFTPPFSGDAVLYVYNATFSDVTFSDVTYGHPFWRYIEGFYNAGITVGCSQSPKLYCPDAPVTRGEMAVFIERALGHTSPSPSPTGMFTDLPYPGLETFTSFIEQFYNEGITVGCLQSPLKYCPQNYVTRGEMAVFIERAIGHPSPTPSPSGMFADLPYPGLESFTRFIEQFYNDGITTGCNQSPLMYCPQNYVTRGEMAVFIDRAFSIPLP